jgi:hypothetical protein
MASLRDCRRGRRNLWARAAFTSPFPVAREFSIIRKLGRPLIEDNGLRRSWHLPPPIGLAVALALSAAAVGPISASAQSLLGRSASPTAGSAAAGAAPGRRTVESVSRDAQRAIRACDDSAALTCVANELTKYAEALQEIAEERREPAAVSRGRRNGCASRSHRLPGCRG